MNWVLKVALRPSETLTKTRNPKEGGNMLEDLLYWLGAIMAGVFLGGAIQWGYLWITDTLTQNYLRKIKERQNKTKK